MTVIGRITLVAPAAGNAPAVEAALARSLSEYKIPRDVAARIGKVSVTELDEDWLIVICTPDAPADAGIDACISDFTARGLFSHILTLLVSGEPDESFPESLLYETLPDGTRIPHEPLAANISAESTEASLKLIRIEQLRLIAPMIGVAFDDLMNRARRRRLKTAVTVGGIILALAAAFMIYALNRMAVMKSQNTELNGLYTATAESLAQTGLERIEAEKSVNRFTAIEARDVLDNGGTETALLICMQMLGEYQTDELVEVFEDALSTLCAPGYVPVDRTANYKRYHAVDDHIITSDFPLYIYIDMPEEADDYKPGAVLKLMKRNEHSSAGYGTYIGDYEVDGRSRYFIYIHWLEHPEKDYILTDIDGSYVYASFTAFLDNGDLLMMSEEALRRFDISTGMERPLFDSEEENEAFEWDIGSCECLGAADKLILAVGRSRIKVFSQEPFRYLYTLEDDYISQPYNSPPVFDISTCSDGITYMAFRSKSDYAVYDMDKGEFLHTINSGRDGVSRTCSFSSDGLIILGVGSGTGGWNPSTASWAFRLPEGSNYFYAYGEYDPESGRCDSSVINTGSVVYRNNGDGIPVPESLEEQLELAEKLLEGMSLTPGQKLLYHLD